MKKKIVMLGTALMASMLFTSTAFAGQWKQNSTGWWWQEDNGTYPINQWKWIDGNQDGIAECYYFDNVGYMLANTNTPDGYAVNADGAWTLNGVVQKKITQTSTKTTNRNSSSKNTYRDYNNYDDEEEEADHRDYNNYNNNNDKNDYRDYDSYDKNDDEGDERKESDVSNDYYDKIKEELQQQEEERKAEQEKLEAERKYKAEMREQIQSEIDDLKDQMTSGFFMTDAQYRKKVSEMSNKISQLQRQISTLSLSTDRADTAKRLKLEEDLSEKEEELEELQNNYSLKTQIDVLKEELKKYK